MNWIQALLIVSAISAAACFPAAVRNTSTISRIENIATSLMT